MRLRLRVLLILFCYVTLLDAAQFVAGDLAPRGNPDGQLNVGDLVVLTRLVNGMITPTPIEQVIGDVGPLNSPDGVLDVRDVLILQRAILERITIPDVIDTLGPNINLVTPLNNVITSESTIMFSGALDGEGALTVNNIDVAIDAQFAFTQGFNLIEGINKFTLNAVDIFGNISSQIITVIKDTRLPPAINFSLLTISETTGQIQIVGLANSVESSSILYITINGTTTTVVADVNGSFTASLTANAGDVIEITVQDQIGNISPTTNYVVGADFQLLTPVNNDSFSTTSVNIVGIFPSSEYSNEGVDINKTSACLYKNMFYVNNYSLVNGTQLLTATHSTRNGTTQTTAVSITRNGFEDYFFTADNYCGSAPLNVNFETGLNINYQDLYIDFNNDGVIDYDSNIVGSVMNFSYESEGVYPATAWFLFSDGTQKQSSLNIVVNNEQNQDAMFKAIWNAMKAALLVGDTNSALQYITDDSVNTYGPVFELFKPNMITIFDELSVIERVSEHEEVTDYAIIRVEAGEIRTYFINFFKGSDGIWRIDSM